MDLLQFIDIWGLNSRNISYHTISVGSCQGFDSSIPKHEIYSASTGHSALDAFVCCLRLLLWVKAHIYLSFSLWTGFLLFPGQFVNTIQSPLLASLIVFRLDPEAAKLSPSMIFTWLPSQLRRSIFIFVFANLSCVQIMKIPLSISCPSISFQ